MIVDNGRKWLYARHTAWICLQFIAMKKNMCKILPVLKRHKKTAFLPLACNTYVLHNAIIAHCSRLPSPAHSVIHSAVILVASSRLHASIQLWDDLNESASGFVIQRTVAWVSSISNKFIFQLKYFHYLKAIWKAIEIKLCTHWRLEYFMVSFLWNMFVSLDDVRFCFARVFEWIR